MRGVVPLGRIAGIPIGMHWSALIGVLLLGQLIGLSVLPTLVPGHSGPGYWLAGGIAALALIVSLTAHELAHAIVARRAGVGVRRITLWLLGGMSELTGPPPTPAAEVRIAVVGPATSLGLGGLLVGAAAVAGALGATDLVVATLSWLATMNIVLGVFNLLPGTPLDGGRVLHGLVWRHSGDRERATRAASAAGQFVGALLAGLGILLLLNGRLDGLWLVVVGWFIAGSAVAERTGTLVTEALTGRRAGELMTSPADVVPAWWTVQELVARWAGEGRPRHRRFPVVEVDGRPVGVLSLAALTRCPPAERAVRAVRTLAHPLRPELVLTPDSPLDQLRWQPGTPEQLAVVCDAGRVVGVLTTTDIARVLELAALEAEHSAPGAPR